MSRHVRHAASPALSGRFDASLSACLPTSRHKTASLGTPKSSSAPVSEYRLHHQRINLRLSPPLSQWPRQVAVRSEADAVANDMPQLLIQTPSNGGRPPQGLLGHSQGETKDIRHSSTINHPRSLQGAARAARQLRPRAPGRSRHHHPRKNSSTRKNDLTILHAFIAYSITGRARSHPGAPVAAAYGAYLFEVGPEGPGPLYKNWGSGKTIEGCAMAMRAIPRLVVQSAEGVKLVIHVSGRWLVDRLALDFDHPSPSRGGRPYLNVEEWKRLQKLREYFEVVSGAPEDAHMLAGASKLARDKRDVMLKLRLSSEFDAVIVTEADGFPPFLSKGQPA